MYNAKRHTRPLLFLHFGISPLLFAKRTNLQTRIQTYFPYLYQDGYKPHRRVCLSYEGDVCDSEIASITHKGFDDTSITLFIDKKTNNSLVVAFRGWKSSNSEVITNTATDLIIYVNGEKIDQIPTTPGKYEVKIDYSNFVSKCDELDVMMYISDVGYFSLNDEGYKIDGIDGLLPDFTMPE